MSAPALLADIGGTNARFALHQEGRTGTPLVLATGDFASLDEALLHALDGLGARTLSGVAACAAGPPVDGVIALTNSPWEVRETVLAEVTGASRVVLVNDFTAIAAALPALARHQLRELGGGEGLAGSPQAVLGPGTGLGVSARLPDPRGDRFITGEGGHVDLAAADAGEDAILGRLRERFGHVSAERVLCGDGLVNLYRAMNAGTGNSGPGSGPTSGGDVTALAALGDLRAIRCLEQFSRWLGAVAADLALTVGALGGVYLAGGVLPAMGPLFPADAFRRRFIDKGRYRDYLASIPTYMITGTNPALVGLVRLLEP